MIADLVSTKNQIFNEDSIWLKKWLNFGHEAKQSAFLKSNIAMDNFWLTLSLLSVSICSSRCEKWYFFYFFTIKSHTQKELNYDKYKLFHTCIARNGIGLEYLRGTLQVWLIRIKNTDRRTFKWLISRSERYFFS